MGVAGQCFLDDGEQAATDAAAAAATVSAVSAPHVMDAFSR